jgi:hypothetical protein
MLIEWIFIALMAYLIINEIWGIDLKFRLDDAFCRLGIAKSRCRVPVRVETEENERRIR